MSTLDDYTTAITTTAQAQRATLYAYQKQLNLLLYDVAELSASDKAAASAISKEDLRALQNGLDDLNRVIWQVLSRV